MINSRKQGGLDVWGDFNDAQVGWTFISSMPLFHVKSESRIMGRNVQGQFRFSEIHTTCLYILFSDSPNIYTWLLAQPL